MNSDDSDTDNIIRNNKLKCRKNLLKTLFSQVSIHRSLKKMNPIELFVWGLSKKNS